ncbi:phosphopantetheine-binding protein [Catellatospora sp. NPDC049111]|uniref:phosphopantetheine-binding protein n=1 Tax=Catellatospora sp. NPDC049111 TaxID=3155271 RepID=UPI003408220E
MTDTTTTPDKFLDVLREFLPELADDQVPDDDVPLSSYGLDSLGSISLMLALEETLDITFPEDRLTPEAFATVGSLRRTVAEIRSAG